MKQTKHNDRRDWLAFHAAGVREYLAAWRDAAARARMGVALDEAAGCLLEHTALLWRYTNDEEVRAGLWRWSAKERTALAHAACRYLSQSAYGRAAKRIADIDALSDDEMNTAETLLLKRDGMQAALDLARVLVGSELAQDHALRHALALTIGTLAQGDEYLLERPDIISVASRILEPLRALVKVTLDKNAYWWLYHARQLDAQFEKELASPAAFAHALGLSPAVFARPAGAVRLANGILARIPSMATLSQQALEEMGAYVQPQAAKTAAARYSQVYLSSGTIAELLKKHARAKAPIMLKDASVRYAAGPANVRALVQIAPCPLPEQPARAAAQWRLTSLRGVPRRECQVIIVDTRTGRIIGAARYNNKTKAITLVEGTWADFAALADQPEKLFLILLAGERGSDMD